MTTLWDTNGGEVVKAISSERRAAGAVAFGIVLTLVVVVDERHAQEAVAAATAGAMAHPCRLLVVIRRLPDTPEARLDAEVQVGGRLGTGESCVLRMYGRLAGHAESVVLPLLAPDTPVVTWWFGSPPQRIGQDPLGVLAGRRITDAGSANDPLAALHERARDYHPGDTDLAWTRITPWRSILAAAFDSVTDAAKAARVSAEPNNPSATLLCGWLGRRLGVPVELQVSRGPGITEVSVDLEGEAGETLRISRPDGRSATLERSGKPERVLPLHRRDLGDLIGEELRRLDTDEVYADSLAAAFRREPPAEMVGAGAQAIGVTAPQSPQRAHRAAGRPRTPAGAAGMSGGTSSAPTVIVHRDAGVLAKAVSARLVTRLVDAQASRGSASLVLTGGGIGTAAMRELLAAPARDAVDWRRLDVWWGDERFLPGGDPDRNETQARAALLDAVDVDPDRVHAMGAADGPNGSDPDAAAERYALALAAAARAEDHGPVPRFDVLLLGVGPDGHVASLFPEFPALHDKRTVVAVRSAPKPPPLRLSLTMSAINAARETWLLAAGEEKAAAVRLALSAGAGPVQVPAAGVRGQARTLWLLDQAAASRLPVRTASPSGH